MPSRHLAAIAALVVAISGGMINFRSLLGIESLRYIESRHRGAHGSEENSGSQESANASKNSKSHTRITGTRAGNGPAASDWCRDPGKNSRNGQKDSRGFSW